MLFKSIPDRFNQIKSCRCRPEAAGLRKSVGRPPPGLLRRRRAGRFPGVNFIKQFNRNLWTKLNQVLQKCRASYF
jgi:hypothetical protein